MSQNISIGTISQSILPHHPWLLPIKEKTSQEKAPLNAVNDNFEKIVLVRDTVKPLRDDRGILTMSVLDFLLDADILNKF